MAPPAIAQKHARTKTTKTPPWQFPSIDDLGRAANGFVNDLSQQIHLPDGPAIYSDWVRSMTHTPTPVQQNVKKPVAKTPAKAVPRRKEPTFLEDLGQGFAEPWTAFTEQAGKVVDRRMKNIREGDLGGIAGDILRSGPDAGLTALYGAGVLGSPLSATVKATSRPVNNFVYDNGQEFRSEPALAAFRYVTQNPVAGLATLLPHPVLRRGAATDEGRERSRQNAEFTLNVATLPIGGPVTKGGAAVKLGTLGAHLASKGTRIPLLGRLSGAAEAAEFMNVAHGAAEARPAVVAVAEAATPRVKAGPPRFSKDSDLPNTGVPSLDKLAIESSSFVRKLAAIERAGFKVQPDARLLDARGEFSSGLFRYNPERMTRLDWAHEWKHLQQLKQVIDRGIKLNGQAFRAMQGPGEIGAYAYEKALWERARLKPSQEYLDWHAQRIRSYDDAYRSFRRLLTNGWARKKWEGIKW